MFKKKISESKLISSVYLDGYETYKFLQNEFKDVKEINDNLLFIVTVTMVSCVTNRMFRYNNIKLDFDLPEKVGKYIYDSVVGDDEQLNAILYTVQLRDEIDIIIKDDKKEMVTELSDYFVNEISNLENKEYAIRSYMINVISDIHFNSKKYLKFNIVK